MKPRCLIVLAMVFVAQVGLLAARGVGFPSKGACLSPDKKWEVMCVEDKEHEGAYQLLLRGVRAASATDSAAERVTNVFEGGRYREVLWSPDGASLAITDWLGSNCSEILICRPVDGVAAKPLSIVSGGALDAITADQLNGHCYWEALYWDREGRLYGRIFGHTDINPSNTFAHYFRFDPKTGHAVSLSSKTSFAVDLEQKIYAESKK